MFSNEYKPTWSPEVGLLISACKFLISHCKKSWSHYTNESPYKKRRRKRHNGRDQFYPAIDSHAIHCIWRWFLLITTWSYLQHIQTYATKRGVSKFEPTVEDDLIKFFHPTPFVTDVAVTTSQVTITVTVCAMSNPYCSLILNIWMKLYPSYSTIFLSLNFFEAVKNGWLFVVL